MLLFALETHKHRSQVTKGAGKLRAAQSSKPARERHSLQNGLPCVLAISKLPNSTTSLNTSPARAVLREHSLDQPTPAPWMCMTLPRKVWKKTGGMLALDPLDPQALALGPLDALAHIPEPLASGASGAWSGTSGPRPGSPPAPDPLDPQVLAPERKTGSFFFPRHCLERKTGSFFFPKVAFASEGVTKLCAASRGGRSVPHRQALVS